MGGRKGSGEGGGEERSAIKSLGLYPGSWYVPISEYQNPKFKSTESRVLLLLLVVDAGGWFFSLWSRLLLHVKGTSPAALSYANVIMCATVL